MSSAASPPSLADGGRTEQGKDYSSPLPPPTTPSILQFLLGSTFTLERTDTMITIGKLKLRGKTDDLPQNWWFASTAIPLLAATIGPLANVLSIAALATKWRVILPNNGQLPEGTDDNGIDIPDPQWEIILNAISLACGFFGNLSLMVNFTKRIRYIIALPLTIISWYIATGLLIGIVVAMSNHNAPIRPGETWGQGFWYAIIAAVLYMIGSMGLMINMMGYFLGHYPQHFDLDDDQRTLILQTMMFFFWLAGGAAVFATVLDLSYANALYLCDVTVLTVGFGDIIPGNDVGRGLIFPYSVIGIIFLGLMISSIRKFAVGMSRDNIIKKHQDAVRSRTVGRTVTSEKELRERLGLPARIDSHASRRRSQAESTSIDRRRSLDQYGDFQVSGRNVTFQEKKERPSGSGGGREGAARNHAHTGSALHRVAKMQQQKARGRTQHKRADRIQKLILLKEEKDRFDTMREIQTKTNKFKQYYGLSMSVIAFGLLWCVGAAVFYEAEKRIQDMSYFQALYFCYVSLLTIGYGDLSPRSNAGKPFFVIWSLIAVPTMTILISDMGDTVISAINRGTFTLADWTVLPKAGVWAEFIQKHPKIHNYLVRKTKKREANDRLERGFEVQNPDLEETTNSNSPENATQTGLTLEKLAADPSPLSTHDLARKLALAIKRTANDLRAERPKKYSYEEWVEFTWLIRFSREDDKDVEDEGEREGLLEWDWIGEDSPMLADVGEAEWVLDRLCESLNRYTRKQAREGMRSRQGGGHGLGIGTPFHRVNPHFHGKVEAYPAHPGPRTPGRYRAEHPGTRVMDFHPDAVVGAGIEADLDRIESGSSKENG
ncbi:hypothetical protein BJ878DRAFT_569235 [Calycina marina]|uniref:Potassium channel domain-containing protein n=1 Tax=Calycina marina TaxID=1763456 RepID=A0A9P7YYZ9_9HELO|nr:hypothetical protein BJ878DRAFT_569235 [Calycina marina]